MRKSIDDSSFFLASRNSSLPRSSIDPTSVDVVVQRPLALRELGNARALGCPCLSPVFRLQTQHLQASLASLCCLARTSFPLGPHCRSQLKGGLSQPPPALHAAGSEHGGVPGGLPPGCSFLMRYWYQLNYLSDGAGEEE